MPLIEGEATALLNTGIEKDGFTSKKRFSDFGRVVLLIRPSLAPGVAGVPGPTCQDGGRIMSSHGGTRGDPWAGRSLSPSWAPSTVSDAREEGG